MTIPKYQKIDQLHSHEGLETRVHSIQAMFVADEPVAMYGAPREEDTGRYSCTLYPAWRIHEGSLAPCWLERRVWVPAPGYCAEGFHDTVLDLAAGIEALAHAGALQEVFGSPQEVFGSPPDMSPKFEAYTVVHWSLLLLVETSAVEHGTPALIPASIDDAGAAKEMAAQGLLEEASGLEGTGEYEKVSGEPHISYRLTDAGWKVAHALRRLATTGDAGQEDQVRCARAALSR